MSLTLIISILNLFQSNVTVRVIWFRPLAQYTLPRVTAPHDAHGKYREFSLLIYLFIIRKMLFSKETPWRRLEGMSFGLFSADEIR